MECKRAENLVDAYLDSELDPLHSMEVEAHLQECTRCASLLERRRALQQALRTKLPYYTAPASLRRKVSGRPSRPWKFVALSLAACLVVAVGGMSWLLAMHGAEGSSMAMLADAVEADHVRSVLTPEHLMDVVSTDQHTVKPWFIGKIPFVPPVRDYAAEGFPLIGGRLDVLDHQTVAALVYHRKKHVINLFVWPTSSGDEAPQAITTPRGFHLVHWSAGGMTFWTVSDVDAGELQAFAELIQHGAPATMP